MTATGERVGLKVQAMSTSGSAVSRLGGQVVFVAGAMPGEEVIAEVERRHRNYLEARVVEVVSASPARTQPRCRHFGVAGSCEWEFIDYPEQVRLKTEILRDQLRRVGHFVDAPMQPADAAPLAWAYRNHVRFVVDASGNPCYLRRASHVPIPVDACAVLAAPLDAALPELAGRLQDLSSVELRCSVMTGEMLISPSLEGRGVALASGQPFYHEMLLGRTFRISPGSFFQVNTGVAEILTRRVLEALELSGAEIVADCYAGVGTFACLLSPHARAVLAIESSPEAVEDGRLNAGFLENVRYRKGAVERLLPTLRPAPDAVVLDPPRGGCDRAVIAALLEGRARRIAYCSCDPATLARDLRLLVDGGFELEGVRLIDMFPQTPHIEALTVLRRSTP